jgi:hypothetical protein
MNLDSVVRDCGPDFLCVGAQKAGTSWLYKQLSVHPDFWMPPRKELHYLNQPGHAPFIPALRNRDKRDPLFFENLRKLRANHGLDLAGYGQLFAAKGSLISGDITPAYCMLPDQVIARVMRCFPRLKVIFLARDPVERAWSQLSMDVRLGVIPAFDVTDSEAVMRHVLRPSILQRSYPSRIVTRWRAHVPVDQFQVLFFDDLENDPVQLGNAIIAFLGGNPEKSSSRLQPKLSGAASRKKLPLSGEVRVQLAKFFAAELEACATELGRAASSWPSRYFR